MIGKIEDEIEAMRHAVRRTDTAHTNLWRYLCDRVIDDEAEVRELAERVRELESLIPGKPAAEKTGKE